MKNDRQGFATASIHAGEVDYASSTPIHQGATVNGLYYRSGNPTCAAFEEKVCTLEGGTRSVSAACGMAAISQTLLALLSAGSRLVTHRTVYTWTTELFQRDLPRLGVEVAFIDMREPDQLAAALAEKTDVVYFEPLANPSCEIVDSAATIEAGRSAGATVVVDATWLSPCLFRPLELGADIVIHSATKYLCGHGDALAGVVTTRDEEFAEELLRMRNVLGGILSPTNAYYLLRGMKTLPIRMQRHCENAQSVAEFLATHRKVQAVRYPGLPDTRGHDLARRQWDGYGGMLSFDVDAESTHSRFLERVELCRPWVSLGDAGSLVTGVREATRIRMSVGLEDVDDILRDLEQALS